MKTQYCQRKKEETFTIGKLCCRCGQRKAPEAFGPRNKNADGLKSACKACEAAMSAARRAANPELKEKDKARYLANREHILQVSKLWKANNVEQRKRYNALWNIKNRARVTRRVRLRRQANPLERLVLSLRHRIWLALRGARKAKSTLALTGCDTQQLKTHIEAQFVSGMGWHNYGKWHIDHILPCASFDFTKEEDQKKCFHFSNLQPLWALDNARKHTKVV